LNELPFTLVSDTLLGLLPVGVTGTCGTDCKGSFQNFHDVAVVNNMPTSWSVATYDPLSGAALSTPQLVPANPSFPKAILTAFTNWNLAPPYAARGNANNSLVLSIGQSSDSQVDNAANLIVSLIQFGLSYTPASCAADVLKPIAAGLVRVQLNISAAGSGELVPSAVFKNFLGTFFDKAQNTLKIVASCTTNQKVNEFLAPVVKLLLSSPLPKKTLSAGFLAYEAAYIIGYWDPLTVSFAICVDGNGNIIDCAAGYTFTPSALYAAVGVEVDGLTTLAAQGELPAHLATGIPEGLVYSLEDPDHVLSLLDADKGLVTTLAGPGTAQARVKVLDPVTNAEGSYSVIVVGTPTIEPRQPVLLIGDLLTLALTDGQGNRIAVPNDVLWNSSDTTVANCVLLIAGATGCGGGNSTTFKALFVGTATVTASSAIAGFSVTSTIAVTCAPEGTWPPTGFQPAVRLKPCVALKRGMPVIVQSLLDVYNGSAFSAAIQIADGTAVVGGGVPKNGITYWGACVFGTYICYDWPSWDALTIEVPSDYSGNTTALPIAINFILERASPDYGERCDVIDVNHPNGPYYCQHFIYITGPIPVVD
jgi:hypothetical protein